MAWTDERVETLKKLWAEGHSASQIAKELGGVTRNAVIGKVHRLGLSGRATPSRPVKRPPRLARPKPRILPDGTVKTPQPRSASPAVTKATREDRAEIEALPPLELKNGEKATVLNLSGSMCKWPIGDPADPNFAFCGRNAECGSPYCAEHAKIAFQPARKRERKKQDEYDYVPKIAARG
ncbi:MAG: GcrA cell cycle regulator [Hyphomonadaceae bacterium]|nr:GcrA cell cycle regulator [Hyphomonadaceae bacterium]